MRLLVSIVATLALMAGLAQADPNFWRHEWPDTNFGKTSVKNWAEIQSGGPPKDGIPAIDQPKFRRANTERRIGGREPVITVEVAGAEPRAYPLRYLTWHEIVNDSIGGIPIAVTYCPLCNSGMVFDRRTGRGTLSFGVSGKLRKSDMVMYDRQTHSWWQQAMGRAIVGDLTGSQLKQLPAWMESWDQFRARHPKGLVLDEPDYDRSYGHNPYRSYDSSHRPFMYNGDNPPHGIPPLERVVRVGDRAWPLTRIRREGRVKETGLMISWEKGQASALDTNRIANGKEVGTVRVRNQQGRDLAHDVIFAFAFHAFWPGGKWMIGK